MTKKFGFNNRTIIFVILSCSLISFVDMNPQFDSEIPQKSPQMGAESSSLYIEKNWASVKSDPTWGKYVSGTGTIDDPYIIQNIRFLNTNIDVCLSILEDNAYIKIRNCSFVSSGNDLGHAVIISLCKNVTFENNTIENYYFGLDIYGNSDENMVVTNCTFVKNKFAIAFPRYPNLIVSNCNFSNNENGIYHHNSHEPYPINSLIQNNTFSSNYIGYAHSGRNNTICNNIFISNTLSVIDYGGYYNNYSHNLFQDNTKSASSLKLENSSYTIVANNTFSNCYSPQIHDKNGYSNQFSDNGAVNIVQENTTNNYSPYLDNSPPGVPSGSSSNSSSGSSTGSSSEPSSPTKTFVISPEILYSILGVFIGFLIIFSLVKYPIIQTISKALKNRNPPQEIIRLEQIAQLIQEGEIIDADKLIKRAQTRFKHKIYPLISLLELKITEIYENVKKQLIIISYKKMHEWTTGETLQIIKFQDFANYFHWSDVNTLINSIKNPIVPESEEAISLKIKYLISLFDSVSFSSQISDGKKKLEEGLVLAQKIHHQELIQNITTKININNIRETIFNSLKQAEMKFPRMHISEIMATTHLQEDEIVDAIQFLIEKKVMDLLYDQVSKGIEFPKYITQKIQPNVDFKGSTDSTLIKPLGALNIRIQPGVIIHEGSHSLEVVREYAAGGMGVIYLVHDLQNKKNLILKQLLNHRYQQKDFDYTSCEEYWKREQEIIQKQSESPYPSMHLIGSFQRQEYGEPVYYLVLEFIPGFSLDKWITHETEFSGIREIHQILSKIIVPLCKHLEFAHQNGLIHRDITPKNIILSNREQELCPILIDWGVAKVIPPKLIPPKKSYFDNPQHYTTAIRSVGNPPEVIMGLEPIVASDIYMLGHIMFYLLTNGKTNNLPKTSEEYVLHAKSFNSSVSEGLNDLIEQTTQYEPADRIQSCSKVLEQLETIIRDLEYLF